jgi:hypothetical protein
MLCKLPCHFKCVIGKDQAHSIGEIRHIPIMNTAFNLISAMARSKGTLSLPEKYNTLSPKTLTSYHPQSPVISLGSDFITWNQNSNQVFRNAKACLRQRNFAQDLCLEN